MHGTTLAMADRKQQKPFVPPKQYSIEEMILIGRRLPPGSKIHQHQQEKLHAERRQKQFDRNQRA